MSYPGQPQPKKVSRITGTLDGHRTTTETTHYKGPHLPVSNGWAGGSLPVKPLKVKKR